MQKTNVGWRGTKDNSKCRGWFNGCELSRFTLIIDNFHQDLINGSEKTNKDYCEKLIGVFPSHKVVIYRHYTIIIEKSYRGINTMLVFMHPSFILSWVLWIIKMLHYKTTTR